MTERKSVLFRLDPVGYDAVARWAGDELRSSNAQIEFLLRRALADAGRMPNWLLSRCRLVARAARHFWHPERNGSGISTHAAQGRRGSQTGNL